jgi:hypothetical protein
MQPTQRAVGSEAGSFCPREGVVSSRVLNLDDGRPPAAQDERPPGHVSVKKRKLALSSAFFQKGDSL